ncbi:MAG: beta/gamma crystallin family protein [Nostoc sp. NOS(2021)]|uniref:beta/gamma crystallin-related protein n=1 Tax=Nostoc sp. NOS(2021) TaxID=2815407 RepID=UPI0025F5D4D2|nr:beta/gamma crystallin-related protein [Nostoc sp. NOS(2021)]MBN3898611.1 beta/gamma crystallin family protein [Nostoc sp. NOS(2021)]
MRDNQHEQLFTGLTTEFEVPAFTELDDEVAATCSGGLAPVTLYTDPNYLGTATDISRSDDNVDNALFGSGANNNTSSIIVREGIWKIYTDNNYKGQSYILEPGAYPNAETFHLPDNTLTAIRRLF